MFLVGRAVLRGETLQFLGCMWWLGGKVGTHHEVQLLGAKPSESHCILLHDAEEELVRVGSTQLFPCCDGAFQALFLGKPRGLTAVRGKGRHANARHPLQH